ncbi:biopolymer transporter ExbD [Devosia sp. UYZn731]|uniref:ExbD/TolR family protein n=1 Tax=Devosia sp. UYZn731 TaxID=3156345 RepID=UPI0033947D02
MPTINVIFLLILYFVAAGSLVNPTEATVLPPEANSAIESRLPRPLLTLTGDGAMHLNGSEVAHDGLASSALATKAATMTVLVAADYPAQQLAGVITTLAAAGLGVQLVTLRRTAP